MKLVRNTGADRVIDLLRPGLQAGRQLDAVTSDFSLFAYSEVMRELASLASCRLLLPPVSAEIAILGSAADRAARNRLQTRWLAKQLTEWISAKTEVRRALGAVPQGALVLRDGEANPVQVLLGALAFSTDGLGLTPGNPLSLIQASETPEEATLLSQWFDLQWSLMRFLALPSGQSPPSPAGSTPYSPAP